MAPPRGSRNNPRGAKPDKLMRDALMVALHREAEDAQGQPTKRLYLVADRLVDLAANGNVPAIKEVFDRIDGKPLTIPDEGSTPAEAAEISPMDLAKHILFVLRRATQEQERLRSSAAGEVGTDGR
jgi:hypothetical protein